MPCHTERRRSVPALLSLALLTAAACGGNEGGASSGNRGGAAAEKRAEAPPREVEVVHPRSGPYARTLELSGALEAAETVDIAARVDGPVTFVGADLGDRVEAGAILARIAADDFSARREQSDAELAQAEADLARLEQLAQSQMATPQSIEQARTRIAVARAQRALSGRQLRDTAVRAPFAGAIARRDVSIGAYVRTGSPLFSLVSADDLRLALEVPERYSAVVIVGTTVRASRDHEEGVAAQVVRVAPTVSQETRTFRVEVQVPQSAGLRPGMFVNATVDVGVEPNAVRVPRGSVVNVLGHDRVIVVRQGVATPVDVEMLGEEDTDAVVLGVTPEDLVVSRGAAAIAPGTRVTPREVSSRAPSARSNSDTERPG